MEKKEVKSSEVKNTPVKEKRTYTRSAKKSTAKKETATKKVEEVKAESQSEIKLEDNNIVETKPTTTIETPSVKEKEETISPITKSQDTTIEETKNIAPQTNYQSNYQTNYQEQKTQEMRFQRQGYENRNYQYDKQRNFNNRHYQNNQNTYYQNYYNAPAPRANGAKPLDARELSKLSIADLTKLAINYNIEDISGIRKQDLIAKIIAVQAKQNGSVYGGGVLEIIVETNNNGNTNRYGFLRSEENNYLTGNDDIYISLSQIKRFGLRKGDKVEGLIRPPKEGERYFAMLQVQKVNDIEADKVYRRPLFENLTPLYPNERFTLEVEKNALTQRVIDLMAPIGKGQRALIVAAPKTGKTIMLQNLANSLTTNHKDIELLVLLIDERPEEVTDMSRNVKGEVLASTFDEPAERHVQVAEMVLEKAKRSVENGKDVVILLDSITRLARAYNTVTPASGRVLTGGLEATSLQKPKRFFGAARNIEEGGSLTIIATALVETGSRMDEIIFEEFKGTGNCEIYLDRKLADRRIFPAIDVNKTSTRREDLLLSEDELNKSWIMRKILAPLSSIDSMTLLLEKLSATKSNKDFLKQMEVSSF